MSALRFFVLAGPTAVGKSEFAVEIAEQLGTEIVGADAFQIYRGFQILSGKPPSALQERVRHHLIDVLPVTENCDAARYATLAGEKIAELNRRGLVPLVVGGSGFYINALIIPLPDLPRSDPELRAQLSAEPLGSLLSELRERDPEAFHQIDRSNRRRVERAIEVIRLTGEAFSSHRPSTPAEHQFPGLVLTRSRVDLHRRINKRVQWMLENGAIEEVASASDLNVTATQMIGVPEIRRFLAREISLEECVRTVQAATRQYAKRQITWFKKQPFLPFDAEGSVQKAVEFFGQQSS
ncbi:MAG: tRNA (adenosine(37)-N6)-dimethylallyltransferase MiaA [Verrucomicrobia bacterium]|nr:tRNA (adenosine(37)-N6)-dimethylallyltransferase MiaA [Verrucomicrobiota bacterium]MBV8484389.1 tRNA (adenosine(37)-N6)-dimethylallyltransferase MiaA [Verrucomicrobiota bacterium]